MGESALSTRLGQAVIGAGSGYAAGGVFGGVDAVMQHKSVLDTLKSINEGGMIGAAAGGAMGAFPGHNLNLGYSEKTAASNQPRSETAGQSELAARQTDTASRSGNAESPSESGLLSSSLRLSLSHPASDSATLDAVRPQA